MVPVARSTLAAAVTLDPLLDDAGALLEHSDDLCDDGGVETSPAGYVRFPETGE